MKRWLWLTLFLIGSFIGISTTLIRLAQAQSVPPLLSDELRFCAGRLCFRGVVLDQTSLDEVETLLSSDPRTALQRNGNAVSASTPHGTVIFATPPDPADSHFLIENIEIDFWTRAEGYPRLGEFLVRYGPPCKMTFNVPINAVTLYYPTLYVNLSNSDGSPLSEGTAPTPWLGIRSVIAYNDSAFCAIHDPNRERTWPGWRWFSRQ